MQKIILIAAIAMTVSCVDTADSVDAGIAAEKKLGHSYNLNDFISKIIKAPIKRIIYLNKQEFYSAPDLDNIFYVPGPGEFGANGFSYNFTQEDLIGCRAEIIVFGDPEKKMAAVVFIEKIP